MAEPAEIKQKIQELRQNLAEEREAIQQIGQLLLEKIEREPGLWEYDFDELEAEYWRRFSTLEKNADCIAYEERFASQKVTGPVITWLRNIFRSLSSPFSRSIVAKDKQFNLEQQNFVNTESIPMHLSVILTLQKIKDRLNDLEEKVLKIQQDQEEWFQELGNLPSVRDKEEKVE